MKRAWCIYITNDNNFDYVEYLLNAASLNDTLLQSYRSFHLTFQSIFIAIGSGILYAIFTLDNTIKLRLIVFVLGSMFIFALIILFKMHKIIKARGRDVSYWHRAIIKAEIILDLDKRCFTRFKINQKKHRRPHKK